MWIICISSGECGVYCRANANNFFFLRLARRTCEPSNAQVIVHRARYHTSHLNCNFFIKSICTKLFYCPRHIHMHALTRKKNHNKKFCFVVYSNGNSWFAERHLFGLLITRPIKSTIFFFFSRPFGNWEFSMACVTVCVRACICVCVYDASMRSGTKQYREIWMHRNRNNGNMVGYRCWTLNCTSYNIWCL